MLIILGKFVNSNNPCRKCTVHKSELHLVDLRHVQKRTRENTIKTIDDMKSGKLSEDDTDIHKTYNPLFLLDHFDPHKHTQVELLHAWFLGLCGKGNLYHFVKFLL
jgi:hypothetical protein